MNSTTPNSSPAREATYLALFCAALSGATIAAGPDAHAIDVATRATDLADLAMSAIDKAGCPGVEKPQRSSRLRIAV